jgi:histidyl-tRNA synthetase
VSQARPAKGTRDFSAAEVLRRRYVVGVLQSVFERYGFAPLETPSFENLETLMGKYGEEGDRLIFKILRSGDFMKSVANPTQPKASELADKALRYDLTVPFARYVAQNAGVLAMPFRRYQIQPVWRADNPQKGRFREFYQCDADVVGSTSLWQEVELVAMYHEAFATLGLDVVVRVNHRGLLAGIAEVAGLGDRLIDFTVALDKLDKVGAEGVRSEWRDRGFTEAQCAALEPALTASGGIQDTLTQMGKWLSASEVGTKAVAELKWLVERAGRTGNIALDVTLARGLNYYTGCIFEVQATDVAMGSVGGGGRYDNLTGIFGVPGLSGVGISFGLDRIVLCLEERNRMPNPASGPQVLVVQFGEAEADYAFAVATDLRAAGIRTVMYPEPAKIKKQFDHAERIGAQWVALAGASEQAQDTVQLKNLHTGEQHLVSRSALGEFRWNQGA